MPEHPHEPEQPPSSSLLPIPICLRGFANEDIGKAAGQRILGLLYGLGTRFDLSRLDGVTVAYDYVDALAKLDRGYEQSRRLERTSDGVVEGVAMTPAVMRNGKVLAHIVLHAGIVEWLEDENSPQFEYGLGILAHEAAHVHDLECRDRAFQGMMLQLRLEPEEEVLFSLADACWSEYAACRLSSDFCSAQREGFEATFCTVLAATRDEGNACILAYRFHGNIGQLLTEIADLYGGLAKYFSYLLGNLAGGNFSELAPLAHKLIQETPYIQPLLQTLTGTLESLWTTYGSWSNGRAEYEPLMKFARELLSVAGIELSTEQGGLYVHVPVTPETTPSSSV